MYTASYIIIYIMIFVFGVFIGSFLNVCIYRIPKEETIVKGSSHCMTCGEKIKKRDLIPVLSWCLLRGKCRNCGVEISPRYTVVELLNGILFLVAFLKYDFMFNPIMGVLVCLLYSALVVVFFMDWDTQLISTGVVMFIGILGLVQLVSNLLLKKTISDITWKSQLIGIFVVSIPLLLIHLLSKGRALGLGDVYLMAAGGFFLGVKSVLVAMFIGMIVGSVVGMILKYKTGNSKFAFGPYLSIGISIAALYGNQLADLYLRFSGFIR